MAGNAFTAQICLAALLTSLAVIDLWHSRQGLDLKWGFTKKHPWKNELDGRLIEDDFPDFYLGDF